MAVRFERVVAFEPSEDTCDCLRWNLAEAACANVDVYEAALGNMTGRATMALDADNRARANTGARFAKSGGVIPVITLDSLHLERVGFIKLDVEGSEPMALQGAKETIDRCKPVILFENKKLWARHFGLPKNAVSALLLNCGYQFVEKVSCDEIWTHGGRQ